MEDLLFWKLPVLYDYNHKNVTMHSLIMIQKQLHENLML